MIIRPLAKLLANRPKLVLIIFAIFTALIAVNATEIYMESNYTSYLPQDDPTIELWTQINEEFQIGQTIIIIIDQTDRVYDIRDYKVLSEMDEIYLNLYEKPLKNGKDPGILSITSLSEFIKRENAKPISQGGNARREIPFDTNKIYEYMERLTISSMKGTLYTDTFDVSVIIIQLNKDADFNSILSKTENAIANRGTNYANMTLTGTIAMQQAIQKESMNNFIMIFPIAIILVSIVLFIFHRTVKGIIIAFIPPAFALALTFGILGMIQPQLTIISVAIVALLIGLGVDYSIHLMNRLVEENNIDDNVSRIEKILRSTGKAVLLSTITTIIGFASLMISSMSPIVTFGFGCAIGIFFCFISAVILVPCLVVILKFDNRGTIPRWTKFADFTIKNSKRIIVLATFLAVISILLIPYVKTDVNYLDMAPKGIPRVDAMFEYSKNFGGGSNFNAMIVETEPNGLQDPDFIKALVDMEQEMRDVISHQFPFIEEKKIEKSVYSFADEIIEYIEIINRSAFLEKLNDFIGVDKIIYDTIADGGVIDKYYSKTIILVAIPIGSSIEQIENVVKEINDIADNSKLPQNGRVSKLTGQDAVVVAVNNKLKDEQVRSMIIAILLVLSALIFIFNSSKFGFLTMVPVFFILMWEPGLLVVSDIPLSLITISIAAIMVGIGIDYGVHITHRFREETFKGASRQQAVRISIERTGLSLVEAALTTIACVASIFFINIQALHEFVIVIILMTAFSCIAAALLMPVFYGINTKK
jgi:hydrophobe/amphiphile efflux-3 (HAE3) family protein